MFSSNNFFPTFCPNYNRELLLTQDIPFSSLKVQLLQVGASWLTHLIRLTGHQSGEVYSRFIDTARVMKLSLMDVVFRT